ncbi:MAG: response regulator [Pseudomonadota bacterium]
MIRPAAITNIQRGAAPGGRLSISLIVSVTLTTVVTLVLAVFSLLFYTAEREQRFDDLRQELAVSADQLAVAVALPTWNFDDSQILAIMRSSLNNRDLHGSVVAATANKRNYVLTRAANGQLVQGENLPAANGLLLETRTIRVAGQAIGTVSVYATPEYVLQDLRQRRLAIIAVILVLDLAIVLSVYVLVWFLMLKPLKAVGQYAATVKAGRSAGASPHKAWFFGELRTLNESIREMVNLLDSRFRAMRESEERLSIATHAANIGIWDWDIVTDKLVWDDEMYRQYKVAPGEFGGNHAAWCARVLPEDLPIASEAIAAALGGRGEYAAEFRIVWPDGRLRHIKADSLTFRDDAGRPLRMVGVNYDITDPKQAEAELLRHRNHLEDLVAERTEALSVAVTEAKAANRAKSVFLATMSHELRTPLNSVIGFSRMMADSGSMSDEEKRNLAIIHRSGQHLLTLINDILELSKIEAGRVTLQNEPVNLQELLQEVMDMVRARAEQFGLAMALDCSAMPDAVVVDGAKLRQVLLNLMSNAVKFVERGGVTLEVQGHQLAGNRHALRFAVRDTGIGVAKADQARIFEPFVQAEGGGAKDGTGLGLTISREFVRLMGGSLAVESELGAGSTFFFTIEAEASTCAPPRIASDVLALAPGQTGRRILVVDDIDDGRKLLVGLLAPLGFKVSEVADGESALALIARERPDLVFMDWRMPGLDGLEATRRLRADPTQYQPRVVMLTASAFEEERQEALAAGADAFLRKPIEHDKLFQVLEQQLGLQFQRGERVQSVLVPTRHAGPDMASLAPGVRAELRNALQELNVDRVTQILDPLRVSHAVAVVAIERMIVKHQYPQLCEMIDTCIDEEGA